MKRNNSIKPILVLLIVFLFNSFLFSQFDIFYHINQYSQLTRKHTWDLESTKNYTTYTMEGKHTFDDFVKSNDFKVKNETHHFIIHPQGIYQYIVTEGNLDNITIFHGHNKYLQIQDYVCTTIKSKKLSVYHPETTSMVIETYMPRIFSFVAYIDIDDIEKNPIVKNKMFVQVNLITKTLQLLYYFESETSCVTELQEFKLNESEFFTPMTGYIKL
jgi:hypothetical protein